MPLCVALWRGIIKNERKGVYYFALSAKQGDATGINNLWYCYENGLGGLPTAGYTCAMALYKYACTREYTIGCSNINKLESWLKDQRHSVDDTQDVNSCILYAENKTK